MWGALGTLYTPKPTNSVELKTALLQYEMICHRCSLIRQTCEFRKRLRFCVTAASGHFEHNTQFKYREGSWHSLLKRLKCWWNSCAKFDFLLSKTYWMFKMPLHVHLKNWTLKFKPEIILSCLSWWPNVRYKFASLGSKVVQDTGRVVKAILSNFIWRT